MAKMLQVCEEYATDHNLQFSTDPSPEKSKSKCIFMTGTKLRNRPRPAALCLYGVELPWVASAAHLGHDLHQDASLEFDCKGKRGIFIQNSTNIRETFKFADPVQILKAVQVYCCDFYGSMLWDLYGDKAQQLYSWHGMSHGTPIHSSLMACWGLAFHLSDNRFLADTPSLSNHS